MQWVSTTSVFWPSDGSFPREQTIENASPDFCGGPRGINGVRIVAFSRHESHRAAHLRLLPDILHLGAAPQLLSPAHLRILKAEFPQVSLMRSIPVVDESSIALANLYR